MQHPEFYKQPTLSQDSNNQELPSISFDKIGPYNIDSLLSKSEKSHVFLAHDTLHKPFVLKILNQKFANNKLHVDQFLQEAKILKMAQHDNVVQIMDQGIADGRPFIVMQFIQGISLRQFIAHYTLLTHDAIEILLQLSYALSHIHSLGIMHLDLKPENILITKNAQVKLIDFGVSQFQDDTNAVHVVASPDYMSPEMKANQGPYDVKSDIYSLGVIAFELFTSKLCFGVIDLSKTQDFVAPFLRKCLSLEKKERFDDIVDCIASLTAIIKNHPMASNFSSNQAIESMTKNLFNDLIECDSLEIGLTYDDPCQNFFYTSNILVDQSPLFVFYNFDSSNLESLCLSTKLQCATDILLNDLDKTFNLADFLESLNRIMFKENQDQPIAFQAIHLKLVENTIDTAGSGMATIFQYCSRKNSVDTLQAQDHKIGAEEILNCSVISNGLHESDQLLVHNFLPHFPKIEQELKLQSIELFEQTHLSGASNLVKSIFTTLKNTSNASQAFSNLFTLQITRLT